MPAHHQRRNAIHLAVLACLCLLSPAPLRFPAASAATAEPAHQAAHNKKNSKTAAAKNGQHHQGPSKAAGSAAKEKLAPVLNASQFVGEAAIGYASAKMIPEICAKLFCYCGCDITDNHNSLLDCYTSMHGVDCHICQEEASLALRLHRDGVSMEEIQRRVDEGYQDRYPFEKPTPALKRYRATRLWNPIPLTDADKPDTSATDDKNAKPAVKPGFQLNDCCKDKTGNGKDAKSPAGN
jgi:hypothetical protein